MDMDKTDVVEGIVGIETGEKAFTMPPEPAAIMKADRETAAAAEGEATIAAIVFTMNLC